MHINSNMHSGPKGHCWKTSFDWTGLPRANRHCSSVSATTVECARQRPLSSVEPCPFLTLAHSLQPTQQHKTHSVFERLSFHFSLPPSHWLLVVVWTHMLPFWSPRGGILSARALGPQMQHILETSAPFVLCCQPHTPPYSNWKSPHSLFLPLFVCLLSSSLDLLICSRSKSCQGSNYGSACHLLANQDMCTGLGTRISVRQCKLWDSHNVQFEPWPLPFPLQSSPHQTFPLRSCFLEWGLGKEDGMRKWLVPLPPSPPFPLAPCRELPGQAAELGWWTCGVAGGGCGV